MIPLHLHPRPVRALIERLASSPMADHLRASVAASFWPTVLCVGLLLMSVVMVTRGHFVAWDGIHRIPTDAGVFTTR